MNTPITVTLSEATRISGIGRTKLYELVGAGKVTAIKSGKSTLIVTDSLRAYLAALPVAQIRSGKRAA